MPDDELVIDKDVQRARERVAEWFDRPEHQPTGDEPREDALDDPAHQEGD